MLVFDRIEEGEAPLDPNLTDLNAFLLGTVGPEVPQDGAPVPGTLSSMRNIDVWLWRNGRTNLHPLSQFPDWQSPDDITGFPRPIYVKFEALSGFAEDLWIGSGGTVVDDQGNLPYVKNFAGRDPVPDKLTECPSGNREPTEEELAAQNGGLPKDLALWWPGATTFKLADTLACSRIGVPRTWSTRLLPGDFDRVPGWGLQFPSGSQRDVRAKGTYEAIADKGFPVRTVEFMRDMDTGNPDDLVIEPENDRYRIAIGILDANGRVGTGSTVILLEFEGITKLPPVRPRC